MRRILLSPVLLVVSGSPSSLVTTKTGVCCKCRNPTSVEEFFGFCSIYGDIFHFTNEENVGMAKIWCPKPIKLNRHGIHGVQLTWYTLHECFSTVVIT